MRFFFILMNLLLIFNNLYSSNLTGQIYNIEKVGHSYKGLLEVRINDHFGKNIKIIPEKNIKILSVNNSNNDNHIYSLDGNSSTKINFIYNGEIKSSAQKLNIGFIEYNNKAAKDILLGKISVDFRKKGNLNLNIMGNMDFGIVPSEFRKKYVKSKSNPKVKLKLDIDSKDVNNTALFLQYPKEISLGNNQMTVKIDNKKTSAIREIESNIKGVSTKTLKFIANKKINREDIVLNGKLFSNVDSIEPGKYSGVIKVKAYYKYLKTPEINNKKKSVVIRR